MDTTMTYEEFKKYTRGVFPNISCREVKNFHMNYFPEQYTIADTPPTPTKGWRCKSNQKEEGINPMKIETNWDDSVPCVAPAAYGVKVRGAMANAQVIGSVPVEATQRDYAIQRIKTIGQEYAETLRKQFHMDDERPRTAVDLIAAIKDGNYVLDTNLLKTHADDIKRGYFNSEFGIKWGTPPDPDGYEAAKEVLKTAAQKALDGATLKPIDQLEAVIDDFEAWKL